MLSLQIHEKKLIKTISDEFYLWRASREPNINFRNLCDWLRFKYPDFYKYNEIIWNVVNYTQFEVSKKNNKR